LAITDYRDAGQIKPPDRPKPVDVLGPGLITGASDDSAVVNGVVAVPVMAMIMLMASRRKVLGEFALKPWLKALGWIATAVMAAAAAGMFATWKA
jgi:hypothetical protein